MSWIAFSAAYLTRLYCCENQRATLSVLTLNMEGLLLFYCVTDIAKRNHEASVIYAEWKALLDSITIANIQEGCDPVLSEYYQSLKARGKHHLTVIGAVSRKMCNVIFTILRENRPYEATPRRRKRFDYEY